MSQFPTRTRRRLAALAVTGAAGLCALPAAADAATPFGSPLTEDPSGGNNANVTQCGSPPLPVPCTRVLTALNSGPATFPVTAPMNGVITKFRIKSGTPDLVTFRTARLSQITGQSALGIAAGTGPSVTLAGTGQIEEYPARVAVQAGDHVALDAISTNAQFGSNGSTKQYQFVPPLVSGQGPRGSTDNEDEELLVQAVLEPDADGDGFGDETQDGCPGNGSATGACPVPDTTKPVISRLRLRQSLFVLGTRVTYTLSEDARVTFRVQKCARPVGKRCALWRTLKGRIVRDGKAGRNRLRLRARIGGRELAEGRYRLVARAVDPAGNKSARKRKRFRIVD